MFGMKQIPNGNLCYNQQQLSDTMVDLSELEKQTNKLKSLGDLVLKEHEKFNEYISKDEGTCIGFGLYKEDNVAVQRTFLSKGATIELHSHEEKEYILVYKGAFKLLADEDLKCLKDGEPTIGNNCVLKSGDGVFLKSYQPHGMISLEDTWVICVTIPAAKEYPDA